jgi:hypothetical protein
MPPNQPARANPTTVEDVSLFVYVYTLFTTLHVPAIRVYALVEVVVPFPLAFTGTNI